MDFKLKLLDTVKENTRNHSFIVYMIAEGLRKSLQLKNYLEIGVASGHTFNLVAPLSANAFAVDVDEKCYEFIKHNDNLKWFCTDSQDFLKNYKSDKFDLIFIDGNHGHSHSLSDFKLSLPLLRDNGIILMHDTYPPNEDTTGRDWCSDTYKTAEWIKKNMLDEVEIATLPFYFGISIIRKTKKQLDWK